jgi:DnaJ domain
MGAADVTQWRRQNSDFITVQLVLHDGTDLRGKVLLARDKTLMQMLNLDGEAFVEFDCEHLGTTLLAKSAIRSLRRFEMPRATQLQDALEAGDTFDPYAILGVSRAADLDQIHERFQALISVYHPDRYASVELPPEMSEYVMTMAKRITAAFAEIKRIIEATRKLNAAPKAPGQFRR